MPPKDIQERTFRYACSIAELCGVLVERDPIVRELSRQLLKAGTSVGANLEEAVAAESRADFVSKCSVSRKEARESRYWLRLVGACDRKVAGRIGPLVTEASELVAVIGAIVRNAKSNSARR